MALAESGSSIRSPKPLPKHWTNYGIGRSGFHIAATINTRDNRLSVELSIQDIDAKPHYHLLVPQKEEIEASIGGKLAWMELPDKKTSRIVLFNEGCDPTNEDTWPNQHEWFIETLEKFDKTFRKELKHPMLGNDDDGNIN